MRILGRPLVAWLAMSQAFPVFAGSKPIAEIPKLFLPASPLTGVMIPEAVPTLPAAAVPLMDSAAPAPAAANSPDRPVSPEAEREKAGEMFDGASRPTDGPPELPSFLSLTDAGDRQWLGRVVQDARRSQTARRVLAQVEALVRDRGRPVVVDIGYLSQGDRGFFHYDWEILRLAASNKKRSLANAAQLLIHELLHVLQRAKELPSDILELELENYVTDIQVSRELGFEPERGSYDWKFRRRLRGDMGRFYQWLKKEYRKDIRLTERGGLKTYVENAREIALNSEARVPRLEKRLKRLEAIAEKMRETAQPEAAVRSFELENIGPAREKLSLERSSLAWSRWDLALLDDPEKRERIKSYAQSVMRRLRSLRRSLRSLPLS